MADETKPPGKQDKMPDEMPLEPAGIIPEEQSVLTLAEISSACAVQTEYIIELVAEGVITPEPDPEIPAETHEPYSWRFTGMHMRHVRIASHLQSDLGVNLAGVGLALQLLDEVEALRTRLNVLAACRT